MDKIDNYLTFWYDRSKELEQKMYEVKEFNILLHAAVLNMMYFMNLGQFENAKSVGRTVLGRIEERQSNG